MAASRAMWGRRAWSSTWFETAEGRQRFSDFRRPPAPATSHVVRDLAGRALQQHRGAGQRPGIGEDVASYLLPLPTDAPRPCFVGEQIDKQRAGALVARGVLVQGAAKGGQRAGAGGPAWRPLAGDHRLQAAAWRL